MHTFKCKIKIRVELKKKKKTLLIGPLPPPSGGVSVHVERLAQTLNSKEEFECAVLDIGKMKFFDQTGQRLHALHAFFYFMRTSLVHIHLSHKIRFTIGRIAKLFFKKVIYTHHNSRELTSVALEKLNEISNAVILVSPLNKKINSDKFTLIPAYIPAASSQGRDFTLENEIGIYKRIIVGISSHRLGKPSMIDGKDLYGFDVLLNAYRLAFTKGMALVLIDPSGTMQASYRNAVDLLNAEQMPVIYLAKDVDFISLLKRTFIFVRPTRSDGDSISVREALQAGIHVIASDCAPRPDGVRVYETKSAESLSRAIKEQLHSKNEERFEQVDYSAQIMALYRKVLA